MSAMFERIRPRGRGCLAIALALAFGLHSHAAADETLVLTLDQARIMRLPERVATLIIGNPLIADASLQSGGMMVLTGKGYGVTNLIALDRSGAVLLERGLQVEGPRGHEVVLYRGMERETYSCAPKCERRITPGDSNAFFGQSLGQTVARAGAAQPAQEKKEK
jgi:Flp pilus assembly secretin CpaC